MTVDEMSCSKEREERHMASTTDDMDTEHADSLRRRYLVRFEEDTLRHGPAPPKTKDLPHGAA